MSAFTQRLSPRRPLLNDTGSARMTALHAVELAIGMALLGVRLLFVVLLPLASVIVSRTIPPQNQDGAMLFITQLGAAASTFLLGTLAFHIPWYASLIAALFVGVTTYTVRNPDVEPY